MSYTYRLASEDKWLYTGLDPLLPKMVSEQGPLFHPPRVSSLPMKLFKLIEKAALKGKHGSFGFGKRESCPHHSFLNVFFDSNDKSEEGPDLADYSFDDGDLGILVMPNKKSICPCQISNGRAGIFATATEPVNERCFILGEDKKICSVSLDPNGTNSIKIIPNFSFGSWVKSVAGIQPRFTVKCCLNTIDIHDQKRNRKYVTMSQGEDPEVEADSISELLNSFGLSAIVDRYPIRRKSSENHGS